MILLTDNNTEGSIVVTLNEKKSLTDPYYLFVFEHVSTNQNFSFVLNSSSDVSIYPERYNEFTIDVSEQFEQANSGFYNYYIYEQLSSDNKEISLTGALLETGKMKMKLNTPSNTINAYRPNKATIKQYNG